MRRIASSTIAAAASGLPVVATADGGPRDILANCRNGFNIVSPGADENVYFPFTDEGRRLSALAPMIEELVLGEPRPTARGHLVAPGRPIVFTMARLDRIKNLAGLVSWWANDERLRGLANLVVVGGHVDTNLCADGEEKEQALLLHDLMTRHALDGNVRWIGRRLERHLTGELYRWVAERRGVFVQPALFEAFGLTVVEAMVSGLPVFATYHGGPSEIIEDRMSGFHVDPNDGAAATARIADFLERSAADPAAWTRVSEAAVARVNARYTWRRYAERIMTFSRIYGFWKFVSGLERQETARYLQTLDHLLLRPRPGRRRGPRVIHPGARGQFRFPLKTGDRGAELPRKTELTLIAGPSGRPAG